MTEEEERIWKDIEKSNPRDGHEYVLTEALYADMMLEVTRLNRRNLLIATATFFAVLILDVQIVSIFQFPERTTGEAIQTVTLIVYWLITFYLFVTPEV